MVLPGFRLCGCELRHSALHFQRKIWVYAPTPPHGMRTLNQTLNPFLPFKCPLADFSTSPPHRSNTGAHLSALDERRLARALAATPRLSGSRSREQLVPASRSSALIERRSARRPLGIVVAGEGEGSSSKSALIERRRLAASASRVAVAAAAEFVGDWRSSDGSKLLRRRFKGEEL